MTYSPRDVQSGISYGYKVAIDSNTGRPTGQVIPITGLSAVQSQVSQSTNAYMMDEQVGFVTNTFPLFNITVSQYQFNHALQELALHGYYYSDAVTYWFDQNGFAPFMFWYVVEHSNGSEELVVWNNCVSSIVANIGDGQTDADTQVVNLFTYTLSCYPSNSSLLNNTTMYKTSDPTAVANAKNGAIPIPTLANFTLDSSLLNGTDTIL